MCWGCPIRVRPGLVDIPPWTITHIACVAVKYSLLDPEDNPVRRTKQLLKTGS